MQVDVQNQAKREIQSKIACLWLQSTSRDGFHGKLFASHSWHFSKNFDQYYNYISIYGLQGNLVDVETVLLYGDPEEGVYMDCPEGMVDISNDEALLL